MTDARIQWVAFKTILVKEIRRFMRIWQQTLLPPAITMTLYFVIVTFSLRAVNFWLESMRHEELCLKSGGAGEFIGAVY